MEHLNANRIAYNQESNKNGQIYSYRSSASRQPSQWIESIAPSLVRVQGLGIRFQGIRRYGDVQLPVLKARDKEVRMNPRPA